MSTSVLFTSHVFLLQSVAYPSPSLLRVSQKGKRALYRIDFAPEPAPAPVVTACKLAALFPTQPLHHTVALNSESEARFLCRSGRGLGI